MTGTVTFDCNEREVNVTTKLERVDMFDKAHLVMLMFETIGLDVAKDMEEIAQLLALSSVMKTMNMTNGTKVDFSGAIEAIANSDNPESDTENED